MGGAVSAFLGSESVNPLPHSPEQGRRAGSIRGGDGGVDAPSRPHPAGAQVPRVPTPRSCLSALPGPAGTEKPPSCPAFSASSLVLPDKLFTLPRAGQLWLH